MKRLLIIALVLLTGYANAQIVRGEASTISVLAWDTSDGSAKTGDATNLTAHISIDGSADAALADTSATELDATNMPGVYVFDLSAGEATGDLLVITCLSTTANIECDPQSIYTKNLTDIVAADTVQISGGSTAADNLELQFDTTGLSGDTFPSTQAQLDSFGIGAGGLSKKAFGFGKAGAEPETNTYTATQTLDGTYHIIEDDATSTDVYYSFTLGSTGTATSVLWDGYMQSNGDSYTVHARPANGTGSWTQIASRDAANGTTFVSDEWTVDDTLTGTGSNAGEIDIRFLSSDGTAVATDRILVVYTQINQSAGYANGAIWVSDTGTAGTENYINGTADNPTTWASAKTISLSLGINKFEIANGSTITLDDDSSNRTFLGDAWNLALGGQNITNAVFIGSKLVTGTATSTTNAIFHECKFGAVTLPPSGFNTCGFGAASGQFTAASDGDYIFADCFSVVPGNGSPVFVYTGLAATTGVNNRRWAGGATYTLDSDITLSHEVLAGGDTTVTTGGADVEIRGITRAITCTLSGAGTVQFVGTTGPITLSGAATSTVNLYGVSSSLADTSSGTTVNDLTVVNTIWDEPLTKTTHWVMNSGGKILQQLTATISHEGTVVSATTNTITLDAGASSTPKAYDPGLIVLYDGLGSPAVGVIMEYDHVAKKVILERDLGVIPDNTTDFYIVVASGDGSVNEGLILAATSDTAQLNALASTVNSTYIGQGFWTTSGTGADQLHRVKSYDGATQTITVYHPFTTALDVTTAYRMLPFPTSHDAWEAQVTEHQPAGSFGAGVPLIDDAITALKYDESTAFPVTSADIGNTEIFRTGADGDTGETLSDEITIIDGNVDSILIDTSTTIPAQITSEHTTTDALIAALNNFDPTSDQVIIATNNDKGGYTISTAGLALFASQDTGEITAVSGSVAALSQGAAGGDPATGTKQDDMVDKLKGLMSKDHTLTTAVGTFDPSTDANEAIRDNMTGTGSGLTRVLKTTAVLRWTELDLITPITNGNVRVYASAAYDAGTYSLLAFTTTRADGYLTNDVWLDVGIEHVFEYQKEGYPTAIERYIP